VADHDATAHHQQMAANEAGRRELLGAQVSSR
jgi:hypothetical protein